jgi:hypothetical protein
MYNVLQTSKDHSHLSHICALCSTTVHTVTFLIQYYLQYHVCMHASISMDIETKNRIVSYNDLHCIQLQYIYSIYLFNFPIFCTISFLSNLYFFFLFVISSTFLTVAECDGMTFNAFMKDSPDNSSIRCNSRTDKPPEE